MQITRLFEIVYILLDRKLVTASELAERFQVSVRTIYRDIETLSQSGIPIYTTKGRSGGICLMENFVLNKSILSEQEKQEILSALQGLSVTGEESVSGVLSKLTTLFGSSKSDWISIDFSDWSDCRQEMFALIKSSILTQMLLTFEYYGRYGEKTSRTVEPIQLWFKDKTWYLKAICMEKQALRTFKLTRMKRVIMLDEHFDLRDLQIDLPTTYDNPIPHIITFTLKVNSSQAYRVYDDFEEEEIQPLSDGSYLVTASYPEDDWVYGIILSYGNHAQIIEPDSLRNIIRDKLQNTLNYYL